MAISIGSIFPANDTYYHECFWQVLLRDDRNKFNPVIESNCPRDSFRDNGRFMLCIAFLDRLD